MAKILKEDTGNNVEPETNSQAGMTGMGQDVVGPVEDVSQVKFQEESPFESQSDPQDLIETFGVSEASTHDDRESVRQEESTERLEQSREEDQPNSTSHGMMNLSHNRSQYSKRA